MKKSNILNVDVRAYQDCGWAKEEASGLMLPWEVFNQICYLLQQMNEEWIGYFNTKKHGDWYEIVDWIIPQQETQRNGMTAKVTDSECEKYKGICHSHVNSMSFHSGEDKETVKGFKWSFVVNNDMLKDGLNSIDARQIVTSPCGAKVNRKVVLELVDVPMELSEGMKKIKVINGFCGMDKYSQRGRDSWWEEQGYGYDGYRDVEDVETVKETANQKDLLSFNKENNEIIDEYIDTYGIDSLGDKNGRYPVVERGNNLMCPICRAEVGTDDVCSQCGIEFNDEIVFIEDGEVVVE